MSHPTLEQLDAYETTPSQIATAIEGLSETDLRYIPGTDEWSIQEVIIHLPDSESVGFMRLRKTIAEDKPTLPIYDEVAWAKNLAYATQDRHLALELFALMRHSSAALLRSIPVEAWECTGIHPERGVITLYDIFTFYLEHGRLHLEQIETLKKALK